MTNALRPLYAATVVFGDDFSNITAKGEKGEPGESGNTILSGSGSPVNSVGNNGDFYIDYTNKLMYGPKSADTWPAGFSIAGVTGLPGTNGSSATVRIGTVTTGVAGSNVQVTNTGTEHDAVLNFVIPAGAQGTAGTNGAAGAAATVAIGTVTTGAAGSQVQVTNSGTANAAVFNFTIPAGAAGASGAQTSTVNVFTKNQSVTPVAANAATVTPDATASNNFKLTLGQNTTLANPTGLTDGMVLNFRIRQDATGGRTLTLGTIYKFPGGTVPTFPTTANALSIISAYYDADSGLLLCNAATDVK